MILRPDLLEKPLPVILSNGRMLSSSLLLMEGEGEEGREGGREGGRKGGREGGRDGGRKGGSTLLYPAIK